jgi:hypothetical protein
MFRAVQQFLSIYVVLFLVAVSVPGCGQRKADEPPPAFSELRTIGRAYAIATKNLDRPPQNKEELLQVINEMRPEADEGEEQPPAPKINFDDFVIHWGVECRDLPPNKPAEWPVLAYAKRAHEGKRYVLRYKRVTQVPEEEFSSLPFPRGVTPP